MFIETSYPRKRGDRARFESEVFLPTTGKGKCVQFWYHMKGGHIGALNVYLKIMGQSESELWTLQGDQGGVWKQGQIPVLSDRSYQVRIIIIIISI